MINYTVYAIFAIVISLIIFGGLIVLQIKLSKNKNKWLGLIIPVTSFVVICLFVALNFSVGISKVDLDIIWQLFISVLACNIPSYIFLVVYICIRLDIKKKNDLAKINIQNL